MNFGCTVHHLNYELYLRDYNKREIAVHLVVS